MKHRPTRLSLLPCLADLLRCLAVAWAALAGAGRGGGGEAGRPAGTGYLKTLSPEPPPFGRLRGDAFPWDGVRIQRWRRERPEADWVVAWVNLETPGLGYRVSDVHYRTGPGGNT